MVAEFISWCFIDLFMIAFCRPLPPPPPLPHPTAVTPAIVAKELQELLLAQEEELTRREEVRAVWEGKARILEKALTNVSADLRAEWAMVKATQKEYLNKMESHIARAKHSLSLDKMLGEKKVELGRTERDLSLREMALAEVHSWGLNPRDNHEEMMEFVKLRRLLQDTEEDHVDEAGHLAILVRQASQVLVDLGMPPILGIPWDLRTFGDVLEAVDVILERLWEAYASCHAPWD
jgi:hypothetical protein